MYSCFFVSFDDLNHFTKTGNQDLNQGKLGVNDIGKDVHEEEQEVLLLIVSFLFGVKGQDVQQLS